MFIDLIRARRSIRKYRQKPVEKDKIDLLIEAGLRAFSSRGSQPWEFVVVTDPQTIAKLSEAKKSGSAFLKDAPLAIVVCVDRTKTDMWIEDASIAAAVLHLAATDLGLGSCWIQIRLRDHAPNKSSGAYVSNLLGLPKDLEVECMIAMGYPDEQKESHPASALQYDKISRDQYGRKGQ
jgi:nitroreductase